MGSRMVLTRLLVTVVAGGAVYLLTNIADPSDEWRLLLAVMVGGAVLIVQYVIDVDQRLHLLSQGLQEKHRETTVLVEGSFARINQATELFGQVETSPLRTDRVAKLVHSATSATSVGPDIVRDFAQEEIGRLASLLEGMSRNVVDRDGEDHEWIVTLTRCSRRTVDAISTSMDHNFWDSETGRRYLRAQREAIQTRGVSIRRLFLVAGSEDVDEVLQRQCENQQSLGIDVRVLVLASVPPSVRLGATNDFVVFDGDLSYEVVFDIEGSNATTTLNFQEDRVLQRIQRFTELWEAATP